MKKTNTLKLEVPGTIWENENLRMEDWMFELEGQGKTGKKREIHLSIQGEKTGSQAVFSLEQIEEIHGWLTSYLQKN